jgi:hypothetical protein
MKEAHWTRKVSVVMTLILCNLFEAVVLKVKMALFLIKHHAMKYWGMEV